MLLTCECAPIVHNALSTTLSTWMIVVYNKLWAPFILLKIYTDQLHCHRPRVQLSPQYPPLPSICWHWQSSRLSVIRWGEGGGEADPSCNDRDDGVKADAYDWLTNGRWRRKANTLLTALMKCAARVGDLRSTAAGRAIFLGMVQFDENPPSLVISTFLALELWV